MDHADAVDESDPIFRFVEKVKRAAAADSGISYKGGGHERYLHGFGKTPE
jgi:hypothetical protein